MTAGQGARFHAVADGYDRQTRRQVKRLVLSGRPPVSPDLVDLSRAYAEYLRCTVGRADPDRGLRVFVGLGAIFIGLGVVILVTGGAIGALYLALGVIDVALLAPSQRRQARKARDGLEQSRAALGLGPLP